MLTTLFVAIHETLESNKHNLAIYGLFKRKNTGQITKPLEIKYISSFKLLY